jgi:hypothetical protein
MMRNYFIFLISGLVLGALIPEIALATTYGNLAHEYDAGEVTVAAQASQVKRDLAASVKITTDQGDGTDNDTFHAEIDREAVQLLFGTPNGFALGPTLGNLTLKDEDGNKISGREYGLAVTKRIAGEPNGVDLGILVSARRSYLFNSAWTGVTSEYNLGLGVTKRLNDSAALYGDLVYSKSTTWLSATRSNRKATSAALAEEIGVPGVAIGTLNETFDEKNPVIVAIGAELTPTKKVSVAVEFHAGAESGLALTAQAGF